MNFEGRAGGKKFPHPPLKLPSQPPEMSKKAGANCPAYYFLAFRGMARVL